MTKKQARTDGRRVRPRRGAARASQETILLVRVEELDPRAGRLTVRLAGEVVEAELDEGLDDAVLETAARTKEPVLAVLAGDRVVVVGALRTRATPGIDRVESLEVTAGTISLQADRELLLRSGEAGIVLRAVGTLETLAREITTRATDIQKIVGRIINLN